MKILVIGDALVSSDALVACAKGLNLKHEYEIKVLEWNTGAEKEAFQNIMLNIEKNGPEADAIPAGLMEEIEDTDILLIHFAPIRRAVLEKAKNLKLIGTCRGGMEHVDVEAATEKGIPVIHVIRNAEPVADFTLGLIYAETRNIARSFLSIKEGRWDKNFSNNPYKTTLSEQSVGLIGLGYIGKLVLGKLNALGVKVYGYDPFVSAEKLREEGYEVEMLDSLEEIAKTADIISLHMRVSEETTHMINKRILDFMKPNAYIINTARAAIIDMDALVSALQEKKIAGAALDVFDVEPIPIGDALLALDNVTLTTHIAGDTIDAIPKAPKLMMNVLNEYFAKRKSDLQVNKAVAFIEV